MITLLDSEIAKAALESQAIVMVCAIDLDIIYVNSMLERLFGYDVLPGELTGMPLSTLLPEDLREKHNAFMREFAKNPYPRPMRLTQNLRGRKKDGSEIQIRAFLSGRVVRGAKILIAHIMDAQASNDTPADKAAKELKAVAADAAIGVVAVA